MGNIGSLMMTLLAGLFIMIGFVIVMLIKNNDKVVQFSISMAFGVMVTLVLIELIPEAYEIMSENFNGITGILIIIFLVLIGVGILKILDKFVPDHDIEEDNEKEINENLVHIGMVSAIALILHNLIEGMAIYSSALTSVEMGLLVTLGVGFHNIPMGMVISSTFYKGNNDLKKVTLIMIIISISTFIGGLLMFFMSKYITELVLGVLLCLTLGMIIYIVVFELLGEIIHNKNKKISILGIIFGVLIFLVSLFLE